ncbi:MAG: hypothetical protein H7X89_16435 [Rhizobiales bacterium]|nr:hypothetical protein [Hyphomicrobiales bacterium]
MHFTISHSPLSQHIGEGILHPEELYINGHIGHFELHQKTGFWNGEFLTGSSVSLASRDGHQHPLSGFVGMSRKLQEAAPDVLGLRLTATIEPSRGAWTWILAIPADWPSFFQDSKSASAGHGILKIDARFHLWGENASGFKVYECPELPSSVLTAQKPH